MEKPVKTARLSGGWYAVAAADFPKDLLRELATVPHPTFDRVLKIEGQNIVAVKTIKIGGNKLNAVFKIAVPAKNIRHWFRSFRKSKALRDFLTAQKLLEIEIPAARPLAAMWQRSLGRVVKSVYICEYLDKSWNLDTFAFQPPFILTPLQRREIAQKIATVLAAMHNNKITHRDTKAANFLVQEKDGLQIVCVDMDGIKPMRLFSRSYMMRTLWRLGAALMGTRNVRRTDFLRAFTAYCDLTNIDKDTRRKLYRKLAVKAQKKFKQKQAFWHGLGINSDRTQPL